MGITDLGADQLRVSTRARAWKNETVVTTRDWGTQRPRAAGAVGYIKLGFYEAMLGGRRLVRYTRRNESAEPCGAKEQREVLVSIPAGAEDGEQIPIEGDPGAFAVLRVSPRPPDSTLVRVVAAVGLLAALGFLAFLFLG
jgi:hypothetical protein